MNRTDSSDRKLCGDTANVLNYSKLFSLGFESRTGNKESSFTKLLFVIVALFNAFVMEHLYIRVVPKS